MITLIVPVYQSEATLERCIKSLLVQTYPQIEIIMVIDGSFDGSGLLADKMALLDSRIRVIYQENQGVSASRNRGLKEAKGEYIQFVDSDDYLEVDACEKMLIAMEQNQVDIVIAGFYHHYFGATVKKASNLAGTYELEKSENEFLILYETQFLNMPWNKLYRASKITEFFREEMSLGEDLIFNLDYMSQIHSYKVIGDLIYHYIQAEDVVTLSSQKRNDRIEIAFALFNKMELFYQKVYGKRNVDSGHNVLPGNTVWQRVTATKVVVEFMDIIENLAFDVERNKTQKLDVIREYYLAWNTFVQDSEKKGQKLDSLKIKQLDYKLIFWAFSSGSEQITYGLIWLRAVLVRMKRRLV